MKTKVKDFRAQRRGGFYWPNEKPHVTVTTVLKVLSAPAIQYWFGKEIYYALAKDPSLSESDALRAPYDTRDKAADRGSLVHSAIEAYKQNKVRVKAPKEYAGYINAFYKWVDEVKPELIEAEKTVVSKGDLLFIPFKQEHSLEKVLAVTDWLLKEGYNITSSITKEPNLEDVFLNLTGEQMEVKK